MSAVGTAVSGFGGEERRSGVRWAGRGDGALVGARGGEVLGGGLRQSGEWDRRAVAWTGSVSERWLMIMEADGMRCRGVVVVAGSV